MPTKSILSPEEQRVVKTHEEELRNVIPSDIFDQATRIVSEHHDLYTSELLNFARRGSPSKIGENQKLKMAQIYEENNEVSLRSLGEQFDLSHETVRRALEEKGVSLRPAGHPFILVEEERKEVARLYQKDDPMNARELSEKFEVSYVTIIYTLEAQGVKRRPPGLPKGFGIIELPMEIIEHQYTNDDKTIRELAEEYLVSMMTIWRRLKEKGVKLRSRGPRKR